MNILLAFLVVLGGISKIYRKFIPVSLGIELKTLVTVTVAYAMGASPAIICAVIMVLISAAVSGRFCHWILIKSLTYLLVIITVLSLAPFGVVTAGKVAVIVLNAVYLLINMLMKDMRVVADLPGNIMNVLFNFFALGLAGEWLVGIMS